MAKSAQRSQRTAAGTKKSNFSIARTLATAGGKLLKTKKNSEKLCGYSVKLCGYKTFGAAKSKIVAFVKEKIGYVM